MTIDGDSLAFRQRYLYSLEHWTDYEDSLVVLFTNLLDHYLRTGIEVQSTISFLDTLKYGEGSITSETIARVADVISYSQSFEIRLRGLRVLDSLILWGDIEAVLVVNYTEHIQLVVKNFWMVRGN